MPVTDEQIIRWAILGQNKEHLTQGTKEEVISELRSWVIRRFQNYADIKACRAESQLSMRQTLSRIQPGNPMRHSLGNQEILRLRTRAVELVQNGHKLDGEQEGENLKAKYLVESIKARGIQWEDPGIWEGSPDAEVIGALVAVGEPGFDLNILRRLYDKEDENALRANRRALDKEAEEKIPGAKSAELFVDPDIEGSE